VNSIAVFVIAANFSLAAAAVDDAKILQGEISIVYAPEGISVIQKTEDAVVQWTSFNISVGNRLKIVQPSKHSRLVIQVTAGGLSDIRGNIESNGQIILINPRGIHHQKAAHAKVGGLILSSLDLDFSGELGRVLKLTNKDPGIIGEVTNFGTIETSEGGNAALVGRRVFNKGEIKGELASVALGVGRAAHILFEDNGLLNLNVTQEEPELPAGSGAPIANLGNIVVPSGRIFIAGSASSPAFELLSKTGGALASDSVVALTPDSEFHFGLGSRFVNRGVLSASNPYEPDQMLRNGGRVVVVANTIISSAPISATTLHTSTAGQILIAASDTVELTKGSDLSVDPAHDEVGGAITILGKKLLITDVGISANEGGQIRIGGKGTGPASQLGDTATISANFDVASYGQWSTGAIDIWAKEAVDIAGSIGAYSYQGGDVEVVSGDKLRFTASVKIAGGTRSPYSHGTILLQAKDINVAPLEDGWIVDAIQLDKTLDGGNVILNADRNLVVTGSPFTLIFSDDDIENNPVGGSSLLLQAGQNLHLQDIGVIAVSTTFMAANDVTIETLTAISSNCHIAAGKNVYVSDSVFIGSCQRDGIQARGTINLVNTLFF